MSAKMTTELVNSGKLDNLFVLKFSLTWDAERLSYSLAVALGDDMRSEPQFRIFFAGIAGVNLNNINGGLAQIGSPRIEKNDDGWDRRHYRVFDLETGDDLWWFEKIEEPSFRLVEMSAD